MFARNDVGVVPQLSRLFSSEIAIDFSLKKRTLVIVPARDSRFVRQKVTELSQYGLDYIVICGDYLEMPNVFFREARGKWDAINFSWGLIDHSKEIIVFNDVDTSIRGLNHALQRLQHEEVSMVFGTETVTKGPQRSWFALMNRLRSIIPVASSGELMVIRKSALESVLPIPPCLAEDTYVLFKLLEKGKRIAFEPRCSCSTVRTVTHEEEAQYKRRTVLGIYQALTYSKPPPLVRFLYALLPFISILLLVNGRDGFSWVKGIIHGFAAILINDESSKW